ncbi:Histidine ammonia-lyase, partial [Caligus rogercresseyi]
AGGKLELPDNYLHLDGCSLSTDDLLQLGKGCYKIRLTRESEEKVNEARKMVEDIVKGNQAVYGITTGFGKFARTFIESDKL